MKTRMILTLLAAVMISPSLARAEGPQDMLAMAAQKTMDSIVLITFKHDSDVGTRDLKVQAICIKETGLFASFGFGTAFIGEKLTDFQVVLPGPGGKPFAAEMVGIDPEGGVAFVRTVQPGKWNAVKFSQDPKLVIGQPVVSVGLLPEDTGYVRYMGMGYVSTMIRTPERQVYVTGGSLTGSGSVVLGADGMAIGVVLGQRAMAQYAVRTSRGAVPVVQTAQLETSFFTPSDELYEIIANEGRERQLAWVGVLRLQPVSPEVAVVHGINQPAVEIGKVIPETPAAAADLREGDVIIEFNGRPIEQLGTPDMTTANLGRMITRTPVGTEVRLKISRNAETLEKTLKTAAMPKLPAQSHRYYAPSIGMAVRERVMLDDYLEQAPKGRGLVVILAAEGSPAEKAGLKTNDLVVSVNNARIETADELRRIVDNAVADKSIKDLKIAVLRGLGENAETRTLTVPLSR